VTRDNLMPLAKHRVRSFTTFAAEAFTDYKTTAAVAPSSRYLAQAMLEPLNLSEGSTVVELGPGTGVITLALLELLPQSSTLLAFEINRRFYRYLKKSISDPRFVLIKKSAEHAGRELRRRGRIRVDAVVSSLGLGLMSDRQRRALLGGLLPFMDEDSVFTQYQYIHGLEFKDGRLHRFSVGSLLRQYFDSVERKMVWRNLPPAFVFACRK